MMVKIERFEAVDRCLFWKEKKILIIGDMHLGYEEALREEGWSVPPVLLDETLGILGGILKRTGKLKEVVFLGDVKHYFGGLLDQEFRDVTSVFELIKKNLEKDGKIVIVKGNHDNVLEILLRKFDLVELKDFYSVDDLFFFHGNKKGFNSLEIYDKKYKTLVIGHFHPAVVIDDDVKRERYKCFLFGKFKGKQMIVVPSFFPLIEGSDVRQEGEIDFSSFGVFVVSPDSSVFDFGKVKNL